VNLSGYVFSGVFLFNPTYAARPGNSGLALLRYGLHVDLDLFRRWLTLSYDLNVFTDRSSASPGWSRPSENDHIVGVLTNIRLPQHIWLTLAAHYEIDLPAWEAPDAYIAMHPDYQRDYSQSYLDAYARATYEHGRFTAFAGVGGFLYNPSYAARPDNSGIALLRYVLHGEVNLLPWLIYRLDFNAFTDRQESPLSPTEIDILSTVAFRWNSFELRFDGEADLNINTYPFTSSANRESHRYKNTQPMPYPGFNQFYLATVLQWSFDLSQLRHRKKPTPLRPMEPFGF
jgi:hypothetical protein